MSTRSTIAYEEDGSVYYIYCHFDGYIANGVGDELKKHFNSFEKAKELVSGGSISSITNGIPKYYTENGEEKKVSKDVSYFGIETQEYNYLFSEMKWKVSRNKNKKYHTFY